MSSPKPKLQTPDFSFIPALCHNIINMGRMQREASTINVMVSLYCHKQHRSQDLCLECKGLLDYALIRLEKCPFQEKKTACAKCPIHCYKPEMRTRIRAVMRFSGPRMIYRHPLLAIRHLIDSRRKKPTS